MKSAWKCTAIRKCVCSRCGNWAQGRGQVEERSEGGALTTPSNIWLLRVSIVFWPCSSSDANGCDMLKHGMRVMPATTP